MTSNRINTDLLIIGAGPVGIFTVFQAGMLGIKSVILETLDNIGGQCQELYPEKPIFDIPAYPVISGQELIEQLRKQAAPFDPQYVTGQTATSLQKQEDFWEVTTDRGAVISCKCIIIAAGGGAFNYNRPPIADIELLENKSIFYAVKNKADFKGKNVVIAGGGDSAVDWAISLSEVAEKVHLVHRRQKFRAMPESVKKVHELADKGLVNLVIPYQLDGLEHDGQALKGVVVKTLDGDTLSLDADALLPFFGLKMELGAISDWGIEFVKNHIEVAPSTMQTNLDRVFAVGDIVDYAGKLKLILTGFSEAAIACHQVYTKIFPDTPLHFEYSTTKGLPTHS